MSAILDFVDLRGPRRGAGPSPIRNLKQRSQGGQINNNPVEGLFLKVEKNFHDLHPDYHG